MKEENQKKKEEMEKSLKEMEIQKKEEKKKETKEKKTSKTKKKAQTKNDVNDNLESDKELIKAEEVETENDVKDETKTEEVKAEEVGKSLEDDNLESDKRKEKIEEQSEMIDKKKKRRSKIITSSIVAALILIIVIVMIILGNLNSTKTENHDFYQWFVGQKVEYKGELTFTRKEGLTELKATDRNVTLDSTPVYYADEKNKVIFPEDMAIVFPNNNGMMYRINHFADLIEENGSIYLETNSATKTNKSKLEKAFLYDGQDLYFFIDRTTISVNGTNYELSPLSYVIVRYKQNVEIYNYEKDEYKVIDTSDTQDAKIITDTYTVNMAVDSLQTADKDQLLIKGLSFLKQYGEDTKEQQ